MTSGNETSVKYAYVFKDNMEAVRVNQIRIRIFEEHVAILTFKTLLSTLFNS